MSITKEFILWNQVTKGEKLKIIIRYFKFYDFDMDINISVYILKNFMKPDLRYINNKVGVTLSNFPIYFGCEKIFKKTMLVEQTRCNGCNVRTNNNDIIKVNNDYYSVCPCGKNYCNECYEEFFIKNNDLINKIKCRGCSNINNMEDIYKYKSGIFPYDLSKLTFRITMVLHFISIYFYDRRRRYMYGQKKVYQISFDCYNSLNINIFDIKNKIIQLIKYYCKHKYTKLIVFSKFYHFINELLSYENKPKLEKLIERQSDNSSLEMYIQQSNNIYKNPEKMLELFLILDSMNKYY